MTFNSDKQEVDCITHFELWIKIQTGGRKSQNDPLQGVYKGRNTIA